MKHKFLAKKYWKNTATSMSEAASIIGTSKDIINLSIGDPDFITHPLIIEGAMEDAKSGHTKYTHPNGDPELIEELIKHYKDLYKIQLQPSELMMTVGACHGMYLALQAIIDGGDEVILPEPYFTPYEQQIDAAGGKLVPLQTREEDDFNIDIKKLKALINERTKAILINSPNNPTGACFSKELLQEISQVAIDNDLILLSDEVYDVFSYEESYCSIASLPGMRERTITFGSFSKAFAMTGWRIGYAIAPSFIIDCMKDINEGICFTASSVSQRAALEALKGKEKIQPSIIGEFKERVFYCYDRILGIPKLSAVKPKAGIYIFINIKQTGMSSKAFSDFLLNKAGVVVLPGDAFGESGEGYVRIACTVDISKLKTAFDRVEALLKDIE